MEVRMEKNGPSVGSPQQTIDSFSSDTQIRQAQWEDQRGISEGHPASKLALVVKLNVNFRGVEAQ
jgi:hypothetical protein